MSDHKLRPETIALHGGQVPDPTTGARAVPIFQTTSYQFKSTEHAANLFGLKEFGNIYTRLMNPTTDVFEQRLAQLDGGIGALGVASGQAAITLALLNIARAGDEIVSLDNLYGGTYNLFHYTFPRLGIKVALRCRRTTSARWRRPSRRWREGRVYAESIGNPEARRRRSRRAARRSRHRRRCAARPRQHPCRRHLLRPFDHGVDIAVYSATKFIGGPRNLDRRCHRR